MHANFEKKKKKKKPNNVRGQHLGAWWTAFGSRAGHYPGLS